MKPIKNHSIIITAFVLFIISPACKTDHQKLYVVDTVEEYLLQVEEDPDMKLIDIEKHINNIVLDIRYATANNFTGEVIYTESKAFLRKPVADALKRVQDTLAHYGLGLLVYDAYRPYSATIRFFEVYPDPDFVADPRYGSRHNRGCAVDVTLIEITTGEKIPMPTGFDEFTEQAHPGYMGFSEDIIANRTFLFEIMAYHGFTHYPTEWWHFDYEGWENFPLMNLAFDEL